MGKINLLSSKIYNRIAAGEVVERPASVVKELIENSIDAGATNIEVSIIDGGKTSIRIIDNGSGIEKNDLKKAILPHATSKISKISDIDNITTLGFRGEALASIASVSKMTIRSKTNEQDFGAEIYVEGGNVSETNDCALPNGTEIEVNNLFFNTPARAKFLKTDKAEENEISNLITRFILGNPNISIKYIADGKITLQSYGDGEESSFVCVYGVEVLNNCFKLDVEKNGLRISGYVGKQYFYKPNRSYQTVFLNGRYISNQTICSAINNAYSSYMMKRQYPFYSLSITMPTEIFDVNVHPGKTDVRFINNQIIYGTIYSVISKVLDGTSEALNIIVNEDKKAPIITNKTSTDYVKHNSSFTKEDYQFNTVRFSDVKEEVKPSIDIFAENKAYIEKLEKERLEKKNSSSNFENKTEDLTFTQEKLTLNKDLVYIGQALNTYLFLEDGEDVFVIDQHAAHERILYDKINQSFINNDVPTQPLLIPYILNVNSYEANFINDRLSILNEMGLDIAEFGGNSFKISSVPAYLFDIDLEKFFNDILSSISNLSEITLSSLFKEKIAQKACKSAIKAGYNMTKEETEILLKMLKNDLGLKCPHGRPICIKITRTEIEKWFKRIV